MVIVSFIVSSGLTIHSICTFSMVYAKDTFANRKNKNKNIKNFLGLMGITLTSGGYYYLYFFIIYKKFVSMGKIPKGLER
jgi:hypothetical protein